MNIQKTFLELTKFTYIYGDEHLLESFFPKEISQDEFGNYFLKIGESNTMFTCHLDTATNRREKVVHVFENNFIKTDENTILGADDKAGMTVLLWMIEHKVPGLYYFFVGEELGCIGSRSASDHLDFSSYKRCISFDRRGYNSVITRQIGKDCCSSEFAEELALQLSSNDLPYVPDPTGIFTDSAMFIDKIPECTNLSVGYFDEHCLDERQDIKFLEKLCQVCLKISWEDLPTKRSLSKIIQE
jgi:hypothetical protein